MKNLLEANAPQAEQAPAGEDPDKNPAYLQAKELMLSKLYEEGAVQGLSQAINSAPDLKTGLIEQTMNLLDVMEQATQGSVPDELVMPFVLETLSEVIQVAEAGGAQVPPDVIADVVAEVLAQVIENLGGDATNIRQEMASVDKGQLTQEMAAAMEEQPEA